MRNAKEFVARAKEKHGNKYDYTRVDYKNARTLVEVVCKIHGPWRVSPYSHAPADLTKAGSGCPRCKGFHRTLDDFISAAKNVHGDKYDYSKTRFFNSKSPLEVFCPKHKSSWSTTWHSHIVLGHGCQKCGNEREYDLEKLLARFKSVHRDNYDYRNISKWSGWHTTVPIICRKHNDIFYQSSAAHYFNKSGCPRCAAEKRGQQQRDTTAAFIKKAETIHGKKYNYSDTKYNRDDELILILCKIHGRFNQRPDHHKLGAGCSKCHFDQMKKDRSFGFEQFIKIAKEIHFERYGYDESTWAGYPEPLAIKCPVHGWFRQRAINHAKGSGCPSCNESKGERKIANILKNMNIEFERQKRFETCRDKRVLPFDFFLPSLKVLIEYDGEQHFRAGGFFSPEQVTMIKKRDQIKNLFASKAQIDLVRIRFDDDIEEQVRLLVEMRSVDFSP